MPPVIQTDLSLLAVVHLVRCTFIRFPKKQNVGRLPFQTLLLSTSRGGGGIAQLLNEGASRKSWAAFPGNR